jgi:hypothetical protein
MVWKNLRHANVLPLLGAEVPKNWFVPISQWMIYEFAMVSEWMTNGDINQFVKANADADRFELVPFSFKFLIYTCH